MERDFCDSFYRALQNSMIGGIIQILKAKSISHKIVITALFLISVFGFIYQFWEFMQLYWQYYTVVDIRVSSSDEAALPSITVCNVLGVLRSKICSRVKDVGYPACVSINNPLISEGKICDCFPERYCDNGIAKEIQVPTMFTYQRILQLPSNMVLNYTHSLDDFILNCTYVVPGRNDFAVGCDLSHSKQMFVGNSLINVGNSVCWTLNTVIGRPTAKPVSVPSYGSLILNLTIDDAEFPFFLHPPLAKISIHSPYQIINPFSSGSTLLMNSENKFRIRKVVKNLLPPPYETDCIDYKKKWEERGGNGPTNYMECRNECMLNYTINTFGCVRVEFEHIPNQARPCNPMNLLESFPKLNPIDVLTMDDCTKQNCGPACSEEFYEVSKESSESHSTNKCITKKNKELKSGKKLRNIITVEIALNGMETTVYSYRPKFESIEIFSNLGGFIGLWLGISLIALYDFLEMIFLVIVYPCKKLIDSIAGKANSK